MAEEIAILSSVHLIQVSTKIHPTNSFVGLKKYQLSPKDLSILAMKLAMKYKDSPTEPLICPETKTNSPEPIYLDLQKIQDAFTEGETSPTGSFAILIRLLGRVFSDAECLGISFLKSPLKTEIDGTDMGLDFEELEKAYTLIFDKAPENVQNVVMSSIERLFNDLNRNQQRTQALTQLRVYTLLLENPKTVGVKFQKQTSSMYFLISKLPQNVTQLLENNFFARFSKEKFLSFFNHVHDFIAMKIISNGDPRMLYNVHGDVGIVSAAKFMGYLWNLNQKHHFVDTEAFYNQVLCDNLSAKVDFFQWKNIANPKDRFSFAGQHPYILNPETKSELLQIETLVNQRRLHQESIHNFAQGIVDLPIIVVSINRQALVQDSIDWITAIKLNNPADLQKQLRIQFSGEDGIDAGGVKKEWFQLLIAEIMSFDFGMFIPDEETQTYWFNTKSPDFIQFELLGTIMGLAIYNSVILDLNFPSYIYKRLLGFPYSPSDLEDLFPAIAKGLKEVEDYKGDDYEIFDLNFVHTFQYLEQVYTHELIPGGQNITVTKENVQLYLDTYRKYLLQDSVKPQLEAFINGFKLVCDGSVIKLFTPKELQLLICGSANLNFEELEIKGTNYEGYNKEHPTIKSFWSTVHNFTLEEKKKFLFFVTGSDRAPIGGLAKLGLVITKHGDDSNRLPTAQTCFNHLFLPPYSTPEKMKELLEKAISNATGFGLV